MKCIRSIFLNKSLILSLMGTITFYHLNSQAGSSRIKSHSSHIKADSTSELKDNTNQVLHLLDSTHQSLVELEESKEPCLNPNNTCSIADPCSNWDANQIQDSEFEKALSKSKGSMEDWVKSLPELKGSLDLKIEEINSTKGINNFGISVIKIQNKSKFILKKSDCDEARKSWKISHSAIANPECILRQKSGKDSKIREFNIKTINDVPHFAKTIAVHESGNRCEMLMEMAPGIDVETVDKAEFLEKIGEKVALLHALGFRHGDLHSENFFYDSDHNLVTLIDYGSLKPYGNSEYLNDLSQFLMPITDYTVFRTGIEQTKNDFLSKGNSSPISHLSPDKASKLFKSSLLHSQSSKELIQLEQMEKHFEKKISFLKGYSRRLPLEKNKELSNFLKKNYGPTVREIKTYLSKNFEFTELEIKQFFQRFPFFLDLAEGKF